MIDICKEDNVRYVFSLNRYKLGKSVKKPFCSCVAVLNYQGAEVRIVFVFSWFIRIF